MFTIMIVSRTFHFLNPSPIGVRATVPTVIIGSQNCQVRLQVDADDDNDDDDDHHKFSCVDQFSALFPRIVSGDSTWRPNLAEI